MNFLSEEVVFPIIRTPRDNNHLCAREVIVCACVRVCVHHTRARTQMRTSSQVRVKFRFP